MHIKVIVCLQYCIAYSTLLQPTFIPQQLCNVIMPVNLKSCKILSMTTNSQQVMPLDLKFVIEIPWLLGIIINKINFFLKYRSSMLVVVVVVAVFVVAALVAVVAVVAVVVVDFLTKEWIAKKI